MLKLIVAPVLGGVIGYITNDLAIKMLFHPRKSVYIGKWHLPFTPGLIPSQKKRIAKSLGRMVSGNLLSGEAIRAVALSEDTIASLRSGVERWMTENAQQTATVREMLQSMVPDANPDDYAEKISAWISDAAMKELKKHDAGKRISRMMLEMLCKRMQGTLFMAMIDDKTISTIQESMAKAVNEAISAHGPELLKNELSKMEMELLGKRICDLAEDYVGSIPALVDMLTDLYRRVLTNHLDSLLHMANIGAIVENKINSFDAEELEKLIFGLMKRELSAIVYLGAVLGFFMGFVNLLF